MKNTVDRVVVGNLEENTYILTIEDKTYLIDPGDEPSKIEEKLNGRKVDVILITHHHFDHAGALDYFEKKYHLIHNQGEDENFKIISTPGHSKDSLTYYFPQLKLMFTGDFIFESTIGRMDLPGGSIKEMQDSLEKIKDYPDDIVLYPGHGDKTILGLEKKNFDYYF